MPRQTNHATARSRPTPTGLCGDRAANCLKALSKEKLFHYLLRKSALGKDTQSVLIKENYLAAAGLPGTSSFFLSLPFDSGLQQVPAGFVIT